MISAPKHPLEAMRQARVDELDLTTPLFVEAYDSVVRLMQAAAQVPICLFSILDGDRQFFKACEGLGDVRETPREQSFCAHAILQDDLDQVFAVPDAAQDPRFHDNPLVTGAPFIRFYAGISIREPINRLPVGTLCLIDTVPKALTPALRDVLTQGRKLLEDQLRLFGESIRDPLTGLYNRRFLQDVMEREWRKAYRQLLPLSVLVLDVDHFKKFNDRYGHGAGDETLRAVADSLRAACVRPGDLAVRYGGEEFLVLLPETDLNGTEIVAAKIVGAISALGIPHEESPHGRITVSIGGAVAHSRQGLESGFRQVILIADEAMYAAKGEGRNRYQVLEVKLDSQLGGASAKGALAIA